MASWYDYIPIVGSLSRIGSGDYKGALYHQLDPLNIGGQALDSVKQPFEHAYNEQENGYKQAMDILGSAGRESKQFQLEGLDKAEGYFDPANQRLNALYGAPGSFRK